MCGIFAYLGNNISDDILLEYFRLIQHRGPDNSVIKKPIDNLFLGFHRLMINGLDDKSNQPFNIANTWLMVNGEIYNHTELFEEEGFIRETQSDCEIIAHLYRKYGIASAINKLDGEFAFYLYDEITGESIIARDHLGVRGLFWAKNGNEIAVASELKALNFLKNVEQFPPRHWWSSSSGLVEYMNFSYISKNIDNEEQILSTLRKLLTSAVEKRMFNSDRPVGCLLSGGLDSSLICALAVRCIPKSTNLHTFSIGMEGSPDLNYARQVAEYLGTTHHEIIKTEQEFLEELEDTIYACETWDLTTIRASTGHRLVAKYVRDNTNIKCLLSGDMPDELCPGYAYLSEISDPNDLQAECIKLLNEIHYFDILRTDRSISYNGIEARVPYTDKYFVQYYLSIDPVLRRYYHRERIEKELLRKAFVGYLPDSILWRPKLAFSNGISQSNRDWAKIIAEWLEKCNYRIDEQCSTREETFYLDKFDLYYNGHRKIIPHYWRPNPKFFGGAILDPSARQLTCHSEESPDLSKSTSH